MVSFNWLARYVDYCERWFYARFPWLLRKRQSKGYGIHSPFAFDLITNVIYSPHHFYAFFDIWETLSQNDISPEYITRFNYLSFRLVHYLQAENILEINSGIGINSLFLTALSSRIHCKCLEVETEKIAVAGRLQEQTDRKWKMISSLSDCEGETYDAIFVDLQGSCIPDIQTLLEMSHSNTFWVFGAIKKGIGKQFWNKIVLDERTRMTFDLKDTGIVFLRPDLSKANYLV